MWRNPHYLFLFICLVCGRSLNMSAGEAHDYMAQYRQTLLADYARETTILSGYSLEQLLEELDAFYSDTLPEVQQKAYYFIYKKSQSPFVSRTAAVERLVKGLVGAGGGTVGQLLGYLRGFSPADFNERTRVVVFARLHYTKTPHYGALVRLAGYLGVGEEELYRHYLTPDLPVKEKWDIALALSRMGKAEALAYCMKKIKSLPVNNNMVDYALPDLIYTRQKQAIAYCVELLYNDEKLCRSSNPDFSESFPCGYRIMELLAPVIVDFPVKTDISGQLDTDDYPAALQTVRTWFVNNMDYKMKNEIY